MSVLKIVSVSAIVIVLIGVAGFFALGISSQSGSAPGLADGRLAPCPDSPNCVISEEGAAGEGAVEPLPVESWGRLGAAIEANGGTVTITEDAYIAAEFKSTIFGFVDDVEFRKTDDAVHVRSASRVGYSDAGANAARVAKLRESLND